MEDIKHDRVKFYAKKLIKQMCKSKLETQLRVSKDSITLGIYTYNENRDIVDSKHINIYFDIYDEQEQHAIYKQMKKILKGKK